MLAIGLRGDVLGFYEKAEILPFVRITSGGCLLYLQEMKIGRIQEAIFWPRPYSAGTFFPAIHKKTKDERLEVIKKTARLLQHGNTPHLK
jgi:hypothetical protein